MSPALSVLRSRSRRSSSSTGASMKISTASGRRRRISNAPSTSAPGSRSALGEQPVDLRLERPVAAAGEGDVLLELVVVDARAGTRRRRGRSTRARPAPPRAAAGGRGDGHPARSGRRCEHPADQRALARAGRAGDDEQAGDGALPAQRVDELAALALGQAPDRLRVADPALRSASASPSRGHIEARRAGCRTPSRSAGTPVGSPARRRCPRLPLRRSRFSCARCIRTAFARRSASIR